MENSLKIDDQIRLLHGMPVRNSIAKSGRPISNRFNIRVWRNEAIEPTLALANRYLTNFDIAVDWEIGPYDDTLQHSSFNGDSVDANLIWIDWRRISTDAIPEVLSQLENIARVNPVSPTFVVRTLDLEIPSKEIQNFLSKIEEIKILDITDFCSPSEFRDQRTKERNGTDLGNAASLLIARAIGLQAIPELVMPALKCLVLDLDNTLYGGILGEMGIFGIEVTPMHGLLANEIHRLRKQGVLLAIASKNELSDVLALIAQRGDLHFQIEDFSVIKANWNNKSQSIREIASELNIGLNAIAFLDDNPVEIHEVVSALPEVYGLYCPSPEAGLNALKIGPRTSKYFKDSTGGARQIDIKMNSLRTAASAEGSNPLDLHKNLSTRLSIQSGENVDLARANDLFARTNQFNLRLNRSVVSESDLSQDTNFVLTAALKDRFNDSGVIAAINIAQNSNSYQIVDFVISCRALGRNLESIIFRELLEEFFKNFTSKEIPVYLFWSEGPRNQPALEWLRRSAGAELVGTQGHMKIELSLIEADSELVSLLKGENPSCRVTN